MPELARFRAIHGPVDEQTTPTVASILHVDMDAFFVSVELLERPELRGKPVIVGGQPNQRGVVTAASYEARKFGVHSAMPLRTAGRLCPHAVYLDGHHAKYSEWSDRVAAILAKFSPIVEMVSIDEAYLDLSGTERLHGRSPAKSLAAFARKVEDAIGITVSIGLSENKFLAKLASDLDKPRGFSVLSRREAPAFLAGKPVTFIWGVGKATGAALAREGFRTIADLQRADETDLIRRLGAEGQRLARLARGEDSRDVSPERETKSVSAETTFEGDIAAFRELERTLWYLAEKVSARLKAQELAGSTINLKLKSTDFRLRTRAFSLPAPTQLATKIFAIGRELLEREADGTKFRLIGIGVSSLASPADADPADLVDRRGALDKAAEHAVDRLRAKFGRAAVVKGLSLDED